MRGDVPRNDQKKRPESLSGRPFKLNMFHAILKSIDFKKTRLSPESLWRLLGQCFKARDKIKKLGVDSEVNIDLSH